MYTDEADTPDTHDFYKKLPDKDIEKDDEVSGTMLKKHNLLLKSTSGKGRQFLTIALQAE